MFNFGILGINARNLLYIKKFNDKKSIRLANNKLQTKNFLAERWIPLAQTYGVIKNRKDLFDFDFGHLPKKNFVIKPNKWSKWQWILIVKFLWEIEENKDNKKKYWLWKKFKDFLQWWDENPNFEYSYQIWNDIISEVQLRRYLVDILDGKYSMTMWNDKIIVEEKLVAWEGFKEFCEYGLADIRIIVFNLVPVAAMIRIPTNMSKWKANLAAWWIWFGINIWSGKINSMLYKNKVKKIKFPDKYKDFMNKKIQYFVNLGYLALDRVITNDGPKLLEINARAWLEVQNISGIKLAKILHKVADLKIEDPEKWVEIAKTLFSKDIWTNSKILFLSQYGKLKLKIDEEREIKYDVIVEIDLNKKWNYASPVIFEEIRSNPKCKILIDLPDNDIIIKDIKILSLEDIHNKKIILWSKIASNYLIKPIHKTFENVNIINEKMLIEKEREKLKDIDNKIDKINRRLSLSPILRPKNYFNELDNFVFHKWKYNPYFVYNRPNDNRIDTIKNDINKVRKNLDIDNIKSWIKKLFVEKLEEMELKLNLILSYKDQNYENIYKYNQQLFGKIDNALIKQSKEKIFDNPNNIEILWDILSMTKVQSFIEKYLIDKKIYWIDINIASRGWSRISVSMWKDIKINLSKIGTFREKELLSILAHEIDTHLIRHINWMRSGWEIFKSWTWFYLKDEEWLAIYNAMKFLPENYQKKSIYKEYFLLSEAWKYDFLKLFDIAKFVLEQWWNTEKIFKAIVRIKRWIENTSTKWPGTVFYKDKVYLEWYLKIKEWLEKWGDENKLYRGKVKIEDLDFII